ncbi:MAG TPA: VIT domain-containing protein [Polyangiaceae bacterium]
MSTTTSRDRFEAELVELLDKTADESLVELVANDDELRDALHAARTIVARLRHAADDYLPNLTSTDTPAMDRVDQSRESAPQDVERQQAAAPPRPSAPNQSPEESTTRPSDTVRNGATAGPLRGKLAIGIAIAAASLLGAVIYWAGPSSGRVARTAATFAPLSATVSRVHTALGESRVEICAEPGVGCRPAQRGQRVGPGMLVRTNARARATLELDDASSVTLGRATALGFAGSRSRGELHLDGGNVIVDLVEGRTSSLGIDLGMGVARLERAKCSITRDVQGAAIEVIRGRVQVEGDRGRARTLRAGETARLEPQMEPAVAETQSDGNAFVAAETLETSNDDGERGRGLGELRAKKPGDSQERSDAVRLARHHARVRIVGPVARTEIDETFTNETDEVLEGIFRFPLPAGAQIERLALEVDGKLVDGAFTDRERASAIWRGSIVHAQPRLRAQIKDEIIWVEGPWRDPALLEWQRGNRFELRIYPIPKRGSRRVVLAYTELVPGTLGTRHYRYPLPQPASNRDVIEDFSLDVQLRGHDPARAPRMVGYDARQRNAPEDVADFSLSEHHFVPQGDLVVDYELASGSKELTAWAYRPAAATEDSYVALLLRPTLNEARAIPTRDYAFTVDTSRSMFGENLRRAAALTTRMIRELSSDDGVVVLACDSSCRTWPHGRTAGGPSAAAKAEQWLKQQTADGASDLVASFEAALRELRARDNALRHVVYVGDGTPSVGPTRAATITKAARGAAGTTDVALTAVAIGTEADLESLWALARGTDGLVIPYVPGTTVAQASYAALTATFAPRLVDARIELPPGLKAVAPERIDAVVKGGELLIVGRADAGPVRGDVVLRGSLKGQPFEQRFSLDVLPIAGDANAFVPRLFAGLRVGELERRGDTAAKAEAIDLSRRFSVASRYTSLLVLESQAMFDAFSLDNRRRAETWTGELEDSSSSSGVDADVGQDGAPGDESAVTGGAVGAGRLAAANAPRQSGDQFPETLANSSKLAKKESFAVPAPMAAAAPKRAAKAAADETSLAPGAPLTMIEEPFEPLRPTPRPRPPVMIPMRRIWERKGEFYAGRTTPMGMNEGQIAAAERDAAEHPDKRSATKALFDAYAKDGNLSRASDIAERWSLRDPLDVEALIARADIAARTGQRSVAIRILGSVVDVRPSDTGAQQRLTRLLRWQGDARLACRFSLALAEFRAADARALADALRCLRGADVEDLSQTLRAGADEKVLREADLLLEKPLPSDQLSGDLRVNATWQGASEVDVDLSMIDPDGHRVSWLGAPTRSVITATNVTSSHEEGLGLRGGKPGEYLLEVTRGRGAGRVEGTANVRVAGVERPLKFVLEGDRVSIGIAKITMVSRLVPWTSPPRWQ